MLRLWAGETYETWKITFGDPRSASPANATCCAFGPGALKHQSLRKRTWQAFLFKSANKLRLIVEPGRIPEVFSGPRNVANKNTHCCHNGHLKPFKNAQASLAFFQALVCCVFLSVVEPGRIELPSKQAITMLSTCLVSVRFSMCT